MRELGSPLSNISGSADVIREFTRQGFIISTIPVPKLSGTNLVYHQISCLPKFSTKQQFRLAYMSLQTLGFSSSEITLDTGDRAMMRRSYIKAVHGGLYVTYHIDLGLLEIYMGA